MVDGMMALVVDIVPPPPVLFCVSGSLGTGGTRTRTFTRRFVPVGTEGAVCSECMYRYVGYGS
jgi:hypothetical protein